MTERPRVRYFFLGQGEKLQEHFVCCEIFHAVRRKKGRYWDVLTCFKHTMSAAEEREEQPMSDCLFCKIIKGEIPSNKVYEDNWCYAFYDIDPQAPTHFLVIPRVHIGSVAQVDGTNAEIVAHIFQVIARETAKMGLDSYRVVSNIGAQAGQSVPHLHFHVLAGRDMTWPPG